MFCCILVYICLLVGDSGEIGLFMDFTFSGGLVLLLFESDAAHFFRHVCVRFACI